VALSPEQAKPELIKPKTGDDSALEKAIHSPTIRQSSVDEIKQVLRLVMVKIGLRAQNWPSDEEKAVLIEHIISNFGGNNVDEIKLAFEMCMAGKLDLRPEDSKCYENFSCAYFSTIMTAYREWSAQAYKFIKPPEKPVQKIFTQDELDNGAREDAERQYQLFLKNYPLRGVDITKCILEQDGLLKNGESVYDFFKRRAMNGNANIYIMQPNV
jgi:hypothetical protein